MEKYWDDLELWSKHLILNNLPEKIDIIKYKANNILDWFDLADEFLYKDEQSDVISLIKLSLNFSEENKYQIINHLIKNWINFAWIYAKRFNLDTSKLDLNIFIDWIKKSYDNLVFSENFDSFINLYKNPIELKKQIWIEWFFEIYDSFLLEGDNIWKISKENTIEAIKNYSTINFNWILLDKLNAYWIYDWDLILNNIFEDSKYAKKIFFDLFILNKEEKKELENMKVDFLNYNFFNDNSDIIINCENDNKSMYSSFEINNNQSEESIRLLYLKLNEILLLKNPFNEFLITFIDITWRVDSIELTSKINKLISNDNSYEDNNQFIDKFKDILSTFLYLLNKSNFNFNVLIFKSNWDKDFDDNDWINNRFYSWKKIKSA